MSPARSRFTAITAFVGSKGNADAKSKTKSSKASKAKARTAGGKAKNAEEKEEKGGRGMADAHADVDAKMAGESMSKACAPFKPANAAFWGGEAGAQALVSREEAPASVGAAVHPQPQPKAQAQAEAKTKVVRSQASKENIAQPEDGRADEQEQDKEMEGEGVDPALSLSARDVRAYEHERQRVKRAEERAARRARKEARGRAPSALGGGGAAGKWAKAWERVEVDGEYVVGGVVKVNFKAPTPQNRGEEDGGGDMYMLSGNEEILLSDLVVYSSGQKKGGAGRGGGLEEEFELVPAVRGVIVLDEGEFGGGRREMEVDEWECVESEDGALSYAQVVLGLHIDG